MKQYPSVVRMEAEANQFKACAERHNRCGNDSAAVAYRAHELLTRFIGDTWLTLPGAEQDRLGRQIVAMREYSNILGERIAAFAP